MLRRRLVERSLTCIRQAAQRRSEALRAGRLDDYRSMLRDAVRDFYDEFPSAPLQATLVSAFEKAGYRLENVLFDSYPGWQVNATVYVPLDFAPPFPAVVIPVGHSGKQFESYQLPAQLFARSGYLAVLFDPPGQSGEKQPGNDHFADGVRCYPVGQTSSRYFVADALRCIDYLETRGDVDLSRGVAMTGVSGGGTTTTLAALLDDRIAVVGPSCCLTSLADLDIAQGYAGCPETHMWRRYAEGVDEIDLLCAAAPKPTLLMAGEYDEVFRIEDTRQLTAEVAAFYAAAGTPERFEFYVDDAGHCYSLAQARRFTRFMNRWLRGTSDQPVPELSDEIFRLDLYDELRCCPRTDVNMRTLTRDRAQALGGQRDRDTGRIRAAATHLAGARTLAAAPEAVASPPFRVWTHQWQQVLLRPETGIDLPATFCYADRQPAPAILHFDDQGRNRLLYRHGLLAQAMDFLDRDAAGASVMAVDLRGWGDSAPAMGPYEMAGWGGVDRTLAYMSNALGDPLMSMRIRDGLAALAYLRTRLEIKPNHVVVTGCGQGGIVALHVAAIDEAVHAAVIWDTLASFRILLESERYVWPADVFVPNVLLHYDLPDLAGACSCPVHALNPLDAMGQRLSPVDIDSLNRSAGRAMFKTGPDDGAVVAVLKACLAQPPVRPD